MEEMFDNICVINFTDNTQLPYETELSEKTTYYNILKPFEVYYKTDDVLDLKTFQKIFCINDVKKIVRELLPIDQDLIVFSNSENPTNNVVHPWKEVKNNFIYDLVKDIL
jgi:signal peptidase I